MTFFIKNETISMLENKLQRKRKTSRKKNTMEKTTLLKIIKTVRELEIKKSKNDSQFKFYNKKRRRIESKKRKMAEETNCTAEEIIEHHNQNKKTLDLCYGFMNKLENENKIINNQIRQYLTNYVLTVLVEKLNKLKTFNYKKFDKIINEISTETNKIHNLKNYNCNVLYKSYYLQSVYLCLDYNKDINIICDYVKYFESHLTKKTITKKFSIDDFKNFIKWNIKTPEQEAQDNTTTEANLNNLKSKIEKLISDYNQERKKLTINQNNYKYMYIRQD